VPGEHVADAGDAAACVASHREPLECKGRPRTVPQQVLEALEIARHVAVDERDPNACVQRERTILLSEHIARRISVEEPLHAEPTHDTTAHLLGKCGQIGLGDWPSRQERRRGVAARFGSSRYENAVGDAGVQVHVVIERRSEAVQEGEGAEPRADGCEGVGVNRHTCRSAQRPLDFVEKDLRESGDGGSPVGAYAAPSLGQRDHPLPHGHRRDDGIDEVGRGLCRVASVARRTRAPALAGEGLDEGHDEARAAARAEGTAESPGRGCGGGQAGSDRRTAEDAAKGKNPENDVVLGTGQIDVPAVLRAAKRAGWPTTPSRTRARPPRPRCRGRSSTSSRFPSDCCDHRLMPFYSVKKLAVTFFTFFACLDLDPRQAEPRESRYHQSTAGNRAPSYES
jgi:hypothetical protein